MPTRTYLVWLHALAAAFVLTLYRPVGCLAFVAWSVVYVWLVWKRAAVTGQRKEGYIAATAGVVGGLGIQGTFLNFQLDIFPHYLAMAFGISGILGFGVAVLYCLVLIKGWYLT